MRGWTLIIVVLLAATAARAQVPVARTKLGLLPFVSKRIAADVTAILDDLLVNAVHQTGQFDVISAGDINALLGLEKMQDMLNCANTSCMAELGGALGVNALLSGSISVLGDELIVLLTLIDTKNQRVIAREQVRVANREALYAEAVERAVQALVATPAAEGADRAKAGQPSVAAANPPPTEKLATVYFTTDEDDPLGVYVRAPGGDERHCPTRITRDNPCTLTIQPGRYTVMTRAIFPKTVYFPAGETHYKLVVTSSKAAIIAGSSVAAAGATTLILGAVNLDCSTSRDASCTRGGAIAAVVVGSVAAYAGLLTLFFGAIGDYDQSEITQPGKQRAWLPHLDVQAPGGGALVTALWAY